MTRPDPAPSQNLGGTPVPGAALAPAAKEGVAAPPPSRARLLDKRGVPVEVGSAVTLDGPRAGSIQFPDMAGTVTDIRWSDDHECMMASGTLASSGKRFAWWRGSSMTVTVPS